MVLVAEVANRSGLGLIQAGNYLVDSWRGPPCRDAKLEGTLCTGTIIYFRRCQKKIPEGFRSQYKFEATEVEIALAVFIRRLEIGEPV